MYPPTAVRSAWVLAAAAVALASARASAGERNGSRPPAPNAYDWRGAIAPRAQPSELPYAAGRPIPPGYAPVTRMNQGLMVTGWVLFGAPYTLSAFTSIAWSAGGRSELTPLMVPVAGPFITLLALDECNGNPNVCRTQATTTLLVLDGVAQTTGAALLAATLATTSRVLVRQGRSALGTKARPEVSIGPSSASLRFQFH